MQNSQKSTKKEETKSSLNSKPTHMPRMLSHDYERRIQDLLEKIDILEKRLSTASDQKYKIINKLKNYEEENDMLRDQISRQNQTNKNTLYDKEKYEKKIKDLETANKIMKEKSKDKYEILNKEIEGKNEEIEKINESLRSKNEQIKEFSAKKSMTLRYNNNYKNELEKQKEINKTQSEKISELQNKLDNFFIDKKNEGGLLLELQHLKDDNLRLLTMLKSTEEYKDFAYLSETVPGGIRFIKPTVSKKAGVSKNLTGKNAIPNSQKDILVNENWVPSDCYTFAVQFKNKYNLDLDENLLNNLLSSLNKIWMEREKKQISKVKSNYQSEISSLRRKLAMKSGYDEFAAKKEIAKLRKDLKQTRDDLRDNIVLNNKLRTHPEGLDLVDNALKLTNTFNNTKKCLQSEIDRLNKQINSQDEKYSGKNQYYYQGCFWMAGKTCEEVEGFERNVKEMYYEFEERVKNANVIAGQNELVDYNIRILNNSVKWFFTTMQSKVAALKEKFCDWKFDTQKNLDIINVSTKKK